MSCSAALLKTSKASWPLAGVVQMAIPSLAQNWRRLRDTAKTTSCLDIGYGCIRCSRCGSEGIAGMLRNLAAEVLERFPLHRIKNVGDLLGRRRRPTVTDEG